MSNDPDNSRTPDTPELDTTAQAIADAAEALAGSEADDSIGTGGPSDTDAAGLERERDHYREAALRAVAELDNYRKRVSREAEQSARYQYLPLLRDLLPGLDNLNRTVQAAEQTADIGNLIQGLQMILVQFDQVFANYSAKPIAAVGQVFDPNLHEAIHQVPTPDHPPMTVLQEVEKGYVLHERVIRPTKVIVASAPPQ